MSRLTSLVNRALFLVAFVLAGLAALEKVFNFLGYTLLRETYSPSRLLELAAIALLFVLALLLREIQHALASKRSI